MARKRFSHETSQINDKHKNELAIHVEIVVVIRSKIQQLLEVRDQLVIKQVNKPRDELS